MSNRRDAEVKPFLKIWRKVNRDVYYTSPAELIRVIAETGLSEAEIKTRMGRGYELLVSALAGQKMTDYDVRFIESALGQIKIANPVGNTNSLGERLTSKYPGSKNGF